MEINEVLALAIGAGIVFMLALYESIMHHIMKNRLQEARDAASSWRLLYRSAADERDFLQRRLESKDCQKVLCYQTMLDEANVEIDRLSKLNETYKRQIESGKKRKAASGDANTGSCK